MGQIEERFSKSTVAGLSTHHSLGHHKCNGKVTVPGHHRRVPQKGLVWAKLQDLNCGHFCRRVFLFCKEVMSSFVQNVFLHDDFYDGV